MSIYEIGQQFYTRGKHPRLCIVTDILRTHNSAGQIVDIRYVAQHTFLGQKVVDSNVCAVTIARGLIDMQTGKPGELADTFENEARN